MKIDFFGAAGCVTGSCYMVSFSDTRFLVDCGMFQGTKALKENNYKEFAFSPPDIDFVLITHAHIDHSGLLPKLVKHGFKGPIFCTEPTAELLRFMLPDSAKIQEIEVMQKNRRNERKGLSPIAPIYDMQDAESAVGLLKGVAKSVEFSPAPGCLCLFKNAGHVLGSSFLEIELREGSSARKIVFSGDLGESDHPIVKDPDLFQDTDYLLIESTYGNRSRPPQDKEGRMEKFAKIFLETLDAGGNLIIPSFALERTQDLMHDISILMNEGKIPETDIIIDSPLAIRLTEVFNTHRDAYDEDARNILEDQGYLFDHPRFKFMIEAKDSMELNRQSGKVIISASGMCDAGRIKHHLKHNLWRPESTILFVGYQAEGTLGRLLMDGEKTVRIHGEEVSVKSRIESIPGYSGHTDREGLLRWISESGKISGKVFVVHGEADASMAFAETLRTELSLDAICPHIGDGFDLLSQRETTPAATAVPRVDAHNLYAELMIRLAEFMRSDHDGKEKNRIISEMLSNPALHNKKVNQ